MGFEGLMSLLESLEFLDIVQVISSNDNSSVHFVGDNESFVESSSDGWESSEWALVINIVSFNSFLWSLESYKYSDKILFIKEL